MTGELDVVRTLLIAVTGVGAILSVFMTYIVTKALMKTLGALVLAGAVVWGVANVDWFKTKVGEETNNSQQQGMAVVGRAAPTGGTAGAGAARAVVVVDAAGSPSSVTLVRA